MPERSWIKLICTVGPASLKPRVLEEMERLGIDLLRINLSHTSLEQMEEMIRTIRASCALPLCVDTEGAQIRTGRMADGTVKFRRGRLVRLTAEEREGDASGFQLTPREALEHLELGTVLRVDFDEVRLKVVERVREGVAVARVLRGGFVGSNKGVAADRDVPLPNFSEKDRRAIAKARQEGIATFAFSFARSEEAVRTLRRMAGQASTIIAKIESRAGLANLEGIIRAADAILMDRGDFSREVPYEQLPVFQKHMIAKAHQRPIPAYVATNLLDSMVSAPRPFRAEVNDIVNALLDGANGLVLAAETAVGTYPIQCVKMVRRIIQQCEKQWWPGRVMRTTSRRLLQNMVR
jgi:pyruvate kinase